MKTNSDGLTEIMARVVRNGEIPYQASRRAVEVLDIKNDAREGREELIVMLEGVEVFISDLETLSNAAGLVTKTINSSLR